MSKFIIKKAKRKNVRKIIRFLGLGISLCGFFAGLYIFFPLISWEIYLRPVFANQTYTAPIPRTTIITKDYINSLLQNSARSLRGVNYSNAQNWIPTTYKEITIETQLSSYLISIPKIKIENAVVSTTDTDLSAHLVNFPGTAIPPSNGNAVIFGHSTLPQLYDPQNYKTIFANIHQLATSDTFIVTLNNTLYTYKIFSITIVDSEDTSYLQQQYDTSYLTIVTCTPPGTIWKRLVIKSKLEKV
jgi:sortase A